jgi:hypothetical protein
VEDSFECHIRLLYKHAKKGFAVFNAAEMMGVPDEVAGLLPGALKAGLKS